MSISFLMRLRSLAVGKIIWSTTAWFFVFFKLTICKIIWSIMIDWLIDRMRKTSRLAIGLGCRVTVWVRYRAGTDLIFFYRISTVTNSIRALHGIDYFYLNDWFEFYFPARIFRSFGDNCARLETELSTAYKSNRVYNEKKYKTSN